MSFGAVIAGTAAVAGAVISSNSAKKSAKTAANAQNRSTDFAQQQYDDWQAIYGPVQDNLSNYYSNLTPDYYEALGLETFELEKNNALDQLNQNLAQRGLTDSGVALQLKSDLNLAAASERAKIRRQAPAQVAQEQSGFLSVGMRADPAPSLATTLNQNATTASAQAQNAAAASGSAWQSATTQIFSQEGLGGKAATGLSNYFNTPSTGTGS